jgi:hypothetical protein
MAKLRPGWQAGLAMDMHTSLAERLTTDIEAASAALSASRTCLTQIASTGDDPLIEFLLHVISEDQQRHAVLFRTLSVTSQNAAAWRTEAAPVTRSRPVDVDVFTGLGHAIDEQLRAARAFRALAGRCRAMNAGLDGLLLESMALERDKHAHLLSFAAGRMRPRRGQATLEWRRLMRHVGTQRSARGQIAS